MKKVLFAILIGSFIFAGSIGATFADDNGKYKKDNDNNAKGKHFTEMQSQIDDLQAQIDELQTGDPNEIDLSLFIIGTWDTASYNNGPNGEGRIIFYADNSFEVEGVLRVIPDYEGVSGTGTYLVFDGIIQVKMDGENPWNPGHPAGPGWFFPLTIRENYISITRFGNQAIFKRVTDE